MKKIALIEKSEGVWAGNLKEEGIERLGFKANNAAVFGMC